MVNYLLISSNIEISPLSKSNGYYTFGTINNVNQNTFNVFTTTNPVTNSFPEFNSCWTNFLVRKKKF